MWADFHNHLMPGADDGALNLDESRAGVRLLAASRIDTLIAAVHFDASLREQPDAWESRLSQIDAAYGQLEAMARAEFAGCIERGAEVRLDTPHPDFSDPRLRLAGTRFVLVEFPTFEAPPFATRMIHDVVRSGWQPVLAHPERYRVQDIRHAGSSWVGAGALLQLNHGSLVGRYGRTAKAAAVALIEAGLISYLSSDYHVGATAWIDETLDALQTWPAGQEAVEILRVNGKRLVSDELPLKVPPLGYRHIRRRLWDLLRP